MKRIAALTFLLLVPLVCSASDAAPGDISAVATDNLEIKSAIVRYKQAGKNSNTKLVVYIDGNKKAAETFNEEGQRIRLEFFDGSDSYQVFLLDNAAVKLDDPQGLLSSYYFLSEPNKDNFLKNDVFLDKECNVYQMPSGIYYFWKGIMLKREFNLAFSLITGAENIEINVPIPKDKFVLPAGVNFVTLKEAMHLEVNRVSKELLKQ